MPPASRDFAIDWQKKDPQIPEHLWNNADWVGFRASRPVEEHETLKGLQSKITKESPNRFSFSVPVAAMVCRYF